MCHGDRLVPQINQEKCTDLKDGQKWVQLLLSFRQALTRKFEIHTPKMNLLFQINTRQLFCLISVLAKTADFDYELCFLSWSTWETILLTHEYYDWLHIWNDFGPFQLNLFFDYKLLLHCELLLCFIARAIEKNAPTWKVDQECLRFLAISQASAFFARATHCWPLPTAVSPSTQLTRWSPARPWLWCSESTGRQSQWRGSSILISPSRPRGPARLVNGLPHW